jgi:hypothetical protein
MSDSSKDWPFQLAENTAVICSRTILEEAHPVLFVSHDRDDHGWQFLDGSTPDVDNAAVVGLAEIVRIDPSLRQIAHIPAGARASRKSEADPWIIEYLS